MAPSENEFDTPALCLTLDVTHHQFHCILLIHAGLRSVKQTPTSHCRTVKLHCKKGIEDEIYIDETIFGKYNHPQLALTQ